MESATAFDVMYEVEAPVANVWEARMMAQSLLGKDLNHGPAYSIEAWDAELDSVQFRVVVAEANAEGFFSNAVGYREVAE